LVKVIDTNSGEQLKKFEFKNKIIKEYDYIVGGVIMTNSLDMIAYGDENDIVMWKQNWNSIIIIIIIIIII